MEEAVFHLGLQLAHFPEFLKRNPKIQGKLLPLCHEPHNPIPKNVSPSQETAKFFTENSLGKYF